MTRRDAATRLRVALTILTLLAALAAARAIMG